MKIAIATDLQVAGHAGQARHWLLYDSEFQRADSARIQLEKALVFHRWERDAPHPLDGIAVIFAGSAGDGWRNGGFRFCSPASAMPVGR